MSQRRFFSWRRFAGDQRGAALMEFGILLPIFSIIVLCVAQYGSMIIAYQQMHNAIASSAVYVMRGGTTTATAQTMGLDAWVNKPSDGALTVVASCTCSGSSANCANLCSDGTYTINYTTVTATGTFHGPLANKSMTSTQVVRTQ